MNMPHWYWAGGNNCIAAGTRDYFDGSDELSWGDGRG